MVSKYISRLIVFGCFLVSLLHLVVCSRQPSVILSLSNPLTNDHILHKYSISNSNRHLSVSSVYHYLPDDTDTDQQRLSHSNSKSVDIRSNHRCRQTSEYNAVFGGCCLQQFRHRYLIALGFHNGLSRSESHSATKFKYKYKYIPNTANTMDLDLNPLHIGCYALNIRRWNISFFLIFQNIYLKSRLYETVSQSQWQYTGEGTTPPSLSFLPQTFHMRSQTERLFFFKHFLGCNKTANANWLFKQNMHQGYGIEFVDDAIFFRRAFLTVDEQRSIDPHCVVGNFDDDEDALRAKNYQIQHTESKSGNGVSVSVMAQAKTIIAQRFVGNVLTLNGRKFHFRSYYLVANFGDPLIVLYGGTLLYISAAQYNADFDARNKTLARRMAITNRAVSKSKDEMETKSDENLWNLTYFAEFIDEQMDVGDSVAGESFRAKFADLGYESGDANAWIEWELKQRMKDIARTVFRAAVMDMDREFGGLRMRMAEGSEVQSYDLLAMDLLMTTGLELKLMEVQAGPMSSFVCDRCKGRWDFDNLYDESESGGNGNGSAQERYWACDFGQKLAEEEINIEVEIQMKKKLGLPLDDGQFKSFHYWQPILWE